MIGIDPKLKQLIYFRRGASQENSTDCKSVVEAWIQDGGRGQAVDKRGSLRTGHPQCFPIQSHFEIC